mmetsp:Transcript_17398/g.39246  ORF Transcript_17398/g.39246 Transcript_17398/m.39246 type:complete len:229 (-) Transcript_17398:355-1041(-)
MALRALRVQDGLHMQLDLSNDSVDVDKHGNVPVSVLALLEPVCYLQDEEISARCSQILLTDPDQCVVEFLNSIVDDRRPHDVREASHVIAVLGQHLGASSWPALEVRALGAASRPLGDPLDLSDQLLVMRPDRGVQHVKPHDLEADVLPSAAVSPLPHELPNSLVRGGEERLGDRLAADSLKGVVVCGLHDVLHRGEVHRWGRSPPIVPQASRGIRTDQLVDLVVELL